jgi:hypothetical protein
MNNKIKFSIAIMLFIVGVGCSKEFLTEQPLAVIAPDNLYVDKKGFEAGLYGLYNLWRRERRGLDAGGSNDMAITAAMIGVDNAYSLRPAGNAPEQVFNDFGVRLNSSDGGIKSLWEWLYQTINAANTIIDRSENPAIKWTDIEKKQIVGEAKLIRAWAYRHLTYLFGDVPLNIKESSGATIKTDWTRASAAVVRAQMEADLLYAEANLAELPVSEGRASKVVAQHYLAELYLKTGDYQKAKDKATLVVNNANYKLITARYGKNAALPGTPFTDMFIDGNSNRSQGNTEVLWVVQNEYLNTGGDANIMRRWWVNRYVDNKVGTKTPLTYSIDYGGRGLGRFAITQYAIGAYEPADYRGSAFAIRTGYLMNNAASLPTNVNANVKPTCTTIGYTTGPTGGRVGVDSVTFAMGCPEPLPNATTAPLWPSIRKWDWAPADPADIQQSSSYNDQVYLRLAETYLLLAEAQFRLNDLAGAATTINVLRARSKASAITAAQVTADFILDERSRELLTEEHRRYSLLRMNKWYERTQKYNLYAGKLITLRDTILPIPQSVIDANLTSKMPQNAGY